MKRICSVIVTYVLLLAQLAIPSSGFTKSKESTIEDRLSKRLDPIFARQMKESNVAGSAIAVVKDGKIVFSKGYGVSNVETKRPVVPDKTIWRIGSISKAVTAMGLVQLAERRKISLQDDVNKHLKSWKISDGFKKPVRLIDLLTHTSGFDEVNLGRKTNRMDRVIPLKTFLKQRLVRRQESGQRISYSTYGISLAGFLIEEITGRSYSQYFRDEIFRPLGMNRTSVAVQDPEHEADMAKGYGFFGGNYAEEPYEYFHSFPASDANSTVTDMGQLMIALMEGGKNKNGSILTKGTADRVHQQQFTNHPKLPGMTLGFFENRKNGIRGIEHSGSMNGFTALMYMSMDNRLGIFIAQNSEIGQVMGSYKDAVLKELVTGVKQPESPRRPENLRRFAGEYRADFYCHTCKLDERGWVPNTVRVSVQVNGTLSFWGSEWDQIEPLVFKRRVGTLDNGEKIVVFRESKDGRIIGLFEGANTYERIARRSSLAQAFLGQFRSGGIESAKEFFTKEHGYQRFYTNEDEMNRVGYLLMNEGLIKEAVEVFKLNTKAFPVSSNAFDSLGEGYFKLKKYPLALKNYERSVLLNPDNKNGKDMITKIKKLISG